MQTGDVFRSSHHEPSLSVLKNVKDDLKSNVKSLSTLSFDPVSQYSAQLSKQFAVMNKV